MSARITEEDKVAKAREAVQSVVKRMNRECIGSRRWTKARRDWEAANLELSAQLRVGRGLA